LAMPLSRSARALSTKKSLKENNSVDPLLFEEPEEEA
jgi:hypothetical protein